MHIILTHEQADFDALASLLGASLLDESYLPVLPHRLNRNARAFVTFYGAELPFIEQRDLPSESVEAVCLVDTQSMITVKGVGPRTRVHVVDHHPRREDLPEAWTITCDNTGASTTLLVEALRERNGSLSVVYATLLLLGIYEDTGTLTYSRTTSRDLEAAAFLLEQGANLRIATDFLNHPLSDAQQRLYDQLRSTAKVLKIHGHTIVMVQGEALEMEEELSTLAHKLRDLLDPDALFVLVSTRSGVQLIARSTSDQIDVSEITTRFGGGGHDRAAAALVRDRTLESLSEELEKILAEYVRPAVTVSQIMSKDPQLLSPTTSAAEAAERMQRYGYEGFPVIQDGKLVGLLTRREVDRAISHKLNLTAASLMKAGEVSVFPDDPIEHLQRLMTDTGWGQVPVIQPETGKVIGIVTRTDLLKILTSPAVRSRQMNLADRLERALSPARLALLKDVAQMAYENRLALYIVGGFVRDLILDHPGQDFDLVIEGDAIRLAQALVKQYGGRMATHARFGTAKWYLEGAHLPGVDGAEGKSLPVFLDLISARTEFYTYPTALPTVERGNIKLDLHRRDFTINTLALRLDGHHYGELHDYWGGLEDLRAGIVRVLHSLSFVDDPTRMLRAVRFEQRFGFSIDPRTLDLLGEALSLLDRVSGDRLRHELDHIIDEPHAIAMVGRLDELGLLQSIHPDLHWDQWLRERFEALPLTSPSEGWDLPAQDSPAWPLLLRQLAYTFWCLRIPEPQAESVATRLKVPRGRLDEILAANRLSRAASGLVGQSPSQVVSHLDSISLPAVYAVFRASSDPAICSVLQNYAIRWRHIHPTVDGNFLRDRGLPPGPAYRLILSALRSAWLDGQVVSMETEAVLLEQLIAQTQSQPDKLRKTGS